MSNAGFARFLSTLYGGAAVVRWSGAGSRHPATAFISGHYRLPSFLDQHVESLFKKFEGAPFSRQCKFNTTPPGVPYRGYTLKEISLVPAPKRLRIECRQPIQSGSERAFEFMKYGIRVVIGGGSAEGGAVEGHTLGFQAAYAQRGIKLELGERLALCYQFHIASSREQAIREAAPHCEESMKMFGELRLVRALTD